VTRYGLTYDDLRAYCLANGKRKPSAIGTTGRRATLKALEDEANALKVHDWIADRKMREEGR